jgi:multidrug resistance efflux pump
MSKLHSGLYFALGMLLLTVSFARGEDSSSGSMLEAAGKTQPAPGRAASIATVVIHPVIEIMIVPGQRVKAGEPIIKMDADEPEADVRAKQAELVHLEASLARHKAVPREQERAKARAEWEAAKAMAAGEKERMGRLQALLDKGATTQGQELQARTASLKAEADERAAEAYLQYLLLQPIPQEIEELQAQIAAAKADREASAAELEHYTINSPIDGIVSSLNVTLGTVSRPGMASWGEIIDPRELDVLVEVTPQQADLIDMKRPAEVLSADQKQRWTGRVAVVGPAGDPKSGNVPVLVRVQNMDERLRCYIGVNVRLPMRGAEAQPPAQAVAR